jgi:lipopolysaccharide export system ATP-binding protein
MASARRGWVAFAPAALPAQQDPCREFTSGLPKFAVALDCASTVRRAAIGSFVLGDHRLVATARGWQTGFRRIFLNLRSRPTFFSLAAFARLRGWLRSGPRLLAALSAGDGDWMMAEDQYIAEQDAAPSAWGGQSGVGPGKTPQVTGAIEPETGALGILAVHHLRKSYKARRVVEDVSMTVRRGEVVGLLGPNGAGKTTLFYMITGLIRPDGGLIELDGHDVTRLPMYRRARLGIGYLPQEASIFRGLNVEDNIRAVLEIIEPSKRKRAAELEALLDEFDIKSLRKTPSIALSGGERRRCEIARALAGRPSFMLLDEPFAGIDPIAVGDIQLLVHHLKQRGIGVLITDHNVRETLGLIDRAYIVHAGRVLVEGTPAKIVEDPKVRRHYLGEGFRL